LTQDISYYLHILSSDAPNSTQDLNLDNPWNSYYTAGNFFKISYLSDQENSNDIDNVRIRNLKCMPRIKEILYATERYPSPIAINIGYGHHGILGLLEKEEFEVSILNKTEEAFSFLYRQSYEAFQKSNGVI
jgi:hypothetical protein